MKRIIYIILIITCLPFYSCDEKQIEDQQIVDKIDYIEINGVKKYLESTVQTTFNAYKTGGCYYYNSSTGNCNTKYRTLTIIDPNHELFTNLIPNYTERIDFQFITNLNNYSGFYKTFSSSSSNLEDDKIYAALIIDNETTIVANSDQNISLKTQGDNYELIFSDVHYGSNIISGHITLKLLN